MISLLFKVNETEYRVFGVRSFEQTLTDKGLIIYTNNQAYIVFGAEFVSCFASDTDFVYTDDGTLAILR